MFEVEKVEGFVEGTEEYNWGTQDGSGHDIVLTPTEYYKNYIYIQDFNRDSEEVSINEIEDGGNLIVNVEEEYPNADFVSYYVPASEDELDWANKFPRLKPSDDKTGILVTVDSSKDLGEN